jgi:hypothetical protein
LLKKYVSSQDAESVDQVRAQLKEFASLYEIWSISTSGRALKVPFVVPVGLESFLVLTPSDAQFYEKQTSWFFDELADQHHRAFSRRLLTGNAVSDVQFVNHR